MPVFNHPVSVIVPEPACVSPGADRPAVNRVVPVARLEVVLVPGGIVVTRSDVSDSVPLRDAVVRVAVAVGVPVEAVIARQDDGVGVSVEVQCTDPVKSAVDFERLVGMVAVSDDGANGFRPPR
jgi:hypothetical protein